MNQKYFKKPNKPYKPSFVNDSIKRIDRNKKNNYKMTNESDFNNETINDLIGSVISKYSILDIQSKKVSFTNANVIIRTLENESKKALNMAYDYMFTIMVNSDSSTSFKVVIGKEIDDTHKEPDYEYVIFVNDIKVVSGLSSGRPTTPVNTLVRKLLGYLMISNTFGQIMLLQKDINACIRERNMGISEKVTLDCCGNKFYFRKKDLFASIVTPTFISKIGYYAHRNIGVRELESGKSKVRLEVSQKDSVYTLTFASDLQRLVIEVDTNNFSINMGKVDDGGKTIEYYSMGKMAFFAPHLMDIMSFVLSTNGKDKTPDYSQVEYSIEYIFNLLNK